MQTITERMPTGRSLAGGYSLSTSKPLAASGRSPAPSSGRGTATAGMPQRGARPGSAPAPVGANKPAAGKAAPASAPPPGGGDAAAVGKPAGSDNLLAAAAEKKKKELRRTFSEKDLIGQRGLFLLYCEAQRVGRHLKGAPGSEASDLQSVMSMYDTWAQQLFPGLHPHDVLHRAAGWSGKAVVKSTVQHMRVELEIPRAQGDAAAGTDSARYLKATVDARFRAEADLNRRRDRRDGVEDGRGESTAAAGRGSGDSSDDEDALSAGGRARRAVEEAELAGEARFGGSDDEGVGDDAADAAAAAAAAGAGARRKAAASRRAADEAATFGPGSSSSGGAAGAITGASASGARDGEGDEEEASRAARAAESWLRQTAAAARAARAREEEEEGPVGGAGAALLPTFDMRTLRAAANKRLRRQ